MPVLSDTLRILLAAVAASYDYRLTPVFNTTNLTGTALLPQVQVINVPLSDIDGVVRNAKGHFITTADSSSFSIIPPAGGCGNARTQTSANARTHGCAVATNAGFFDIQNTTHPHCLGTVVTDGQLIQTDSHNNVHFGLTSDGHWFTGYVSDTLIKQHTLNSTSCTLAYCPQPTDWYFTQLASGVIQLIKDGEIYVNQSILLDDPTTQTTGTNQYFANVLSARTAIGVLADGRLGMVQIDGKTGRDGIDLHTMADMLKSMGFQQAINWDGGGSATTVVDDVLVNEPSDACPQDTTGYMGCERAVTTIACLNRTPQQIIN